MYFYEAKSPRDCTLEPGRIIIIMSSYERKLLHIFKMITCPYPFIPMLGRQKLAKRINAKKKFESIEQNTSSQLLLASIRNFVFEVRGFRHTQH